MPLIKVTKHTKKVRSVHCEQFMSGTESMLHFCIYSSVHDPAAHHIPRSWTAHKRAWLISPFMAAIKESYSYKLSLQTFDVFRPEIHACCPKSCPSYTCSTSAISLDFIFFMQYSFSAHTFALVAIHITRVGHPIAFLETSQMLQDWK